MPLERMKELAAASAWEGASRQRSGGVQGGGRKGWGDPQDRARAGRPEEVVRLYDTLASLTAELSEVAGDLGGVGGEALLDATAAQVPP